MSKILVTFKNTCQKYLNWLSLLFIWIILGILIWCGSIFWLKWALPGVSLSLFPDKNLHFITCDVGQGDGLVISLGYHQIVIDGGPDNRILDCLKSNLPLVDTQIELLIITHLHEDHMAGIPAVLQAYKVDRIWLPPQFHASLSSQPLVEAIRQELVTGAKLEQPEVGWTVELGPQTFGQVIAPDLGEKRPLYDSPEAILSALLMSQALEKEESGSSINNGSVALYLKHNNISFLLVGDMEKESELALLNKNLTTDINILKVGHHGSKTSSSLAFLQEFKPEIGVISSGKKNRYGHPDLSVIERLKSLGVVILRTDQQGTLRLTSDGNQVWW
jgi:competence protein ComEC